MRRRPRRPGRRAANGSRGAGSGEASVFSGVRSRRCCSSPRWASGSATWSTRAPGSVDGVDYLVFVAPGLMAASAVMQARGRVAVAGDGRREVDAHVPRRGRDAGAARATCSRVTLLWIVPARADVGDGVPRRRRDPRRRAVVCGVCSRSRPTVLGALGVRGAAVGVGGHPGERLPVRGHHAHRGVPAVPVLGHVLPDQPAARLARSRCRGLSPLWHAVELCRAATTGSVAVGRDGGRSRRVPGRVPRVGLLVGRAQVHPDADVVITRDPRSRKRGRRRQQRAGRAPAGRRAQHRSRTGACGCVFLTGLFEPLLYLLSIGIGVGGLVGKVPGPGGQPIAVRRSSSRPG